MKHIQIIFTLFTVSVLIGCAEPKPNGLPKLSPVSLTFTQDGVPCDGASVYLSPIDESPWASGGGTDTAGTVEFRTHGKFIGVPAGKYKITVQKHEVEVLGEVPKEPRGMYDPVPERKTYNIVDTKFADIKTTPLEIEVPEGKKVSQQFDLGKKIRTPVVKPPM